MACTFHCTMDRKEEATSPSTESFTAANQGNIVAAVNCSLQI